MAGWLGVRWEVQEEDKMGIRAWKGLGAGREWREWEGAAEQMAGNR